MSRGHASHKASGDDGGSLSFGECGWGKGYHQSVDVQIGHVCRDERYGEHDARAGFLSLGGLYEPQGSALQAVFGELHVRYVDPHGDASREDSRSSGGAFAAGALVPAFRRIAA